MSTTIRVSVDDKVGTLALDNFAKRNALGATTVREMLSALSEFERQGVRAIVLRPAELRDVWSAGHDIDELPVRGVDPLPFADPLEELLRAVRGVPGRGHRNGPRHGLGRRMRPGPELRHGGRGRDRGVRRDPGPARPALLGLGDPVLPGPPSPQRGERADDDRRSHTGGARLCRRDPQSPREQRHAPRPHVRTRPEGEEPLGPTPSAPTSCRRPRSSAPSRCRLRTPSGSTSCATTSTQVTTTQRASTPSGRSTLRTSSSRSHHRSARPLGRCPRVVRGHRGVRRSSPSTPATAAIARPSGHRFSLVGRRFSAVSTLAARKGMMPVTCRPVRR